MTQMEWAREGQRTDAMICVAAKEGVDAEGIRERVASGRVVIPCNRNHVNLKPIGIGEGLATKTNANIGTSPNHADLDEELEKLRIAVATGADTIMDLSTGGDLNAIRRALIERSPVPLGTVPIYQTVVEKDGVEGMTAGDLLGTIRTHAEQGVDFITVHCGLTRSALPLVEKRVTGIVSRGGGFLARWMTLTGTENPLYVHFDELLDIAEEYDVTLSLGDGLRPGCIEDATDEAQLAELRTLGQLTLRARQRGVQVMVEGPGHVPLDQIQRNIALQQEICGGAPFYVLGPLVTDVAPGYDHITGAIGGALAAFYGAAFLCYVTPAEHLRLPTVADVREGVIAARIAAHAADVARGLPSARAWDREMAEQRRGLNWEGMIRRSMDPHKARRYRTDSEIGEGQECTMCGKFCVMKLQLGEEAV